MVLGDGQRAPRRGGARADPRPAAGIGARMRTVTGGSTPESSDRRGGAPWAGAGVHRARGERRRPGGDAGRRGPRARAPCPACACAASRGSTPRSPSASPTSRSSATRSSRWTSRPGRIPPTGASALLIALKGLERAFGRQERERWGPREVDLDLLVFGRHRVDVERPPEGRCDDPAKASLPLVVPHVEARQRLFVLAPLSDLAPGLVPPGWGETVATAADRQRAWRARTPPARSRPGTARAGRRSRVRLSGGSIRRPASGADPETTGSPVRSSCRVPHGSTRVIAGTRLPPGSPARRPGPPTAGRRAADPGRTCGPCPRTGPAWSGRPSPASGSAPRRRRTGRPGAARRS